MAKSIWLNAILPPQLRVYKTPIKTTSIITSRIENSGFKHCIESIIKTYDFKRIGSEGSKVSDKYSSTTHDGTILLIHNARLNYYPENYGLTYVGVDKQIVNSIESKIIDTRYLKIEK